MKWKNIIIFIFITGIAGFLLGITYTCTYDLIQKSNEASLQQSYIDVFNEADTFINNEWYSEEELALFVELQQSTTTIESVLDAYYNDEHIGYVFLITSYEGYNGDISFTIGIDLNNNIQGISIVEISETPGLGMEVDNEDYLSQYIDKAVSYFTLVKTIALNNDEIEMISGATYSSSAINEGVNIALQYINEVLKGEGYE